MRGTLLSLLCLTCSEYGSICDRVCWCVCVCVCVCVYLKCTRVRVSCRHTQCTACHSIGRNDNTRLLAWYLTVVVVAPTQNMLCFVDGTCEVCIHFTTHTHTHTHTHIHTNKHTNNQTHTETHTQKHTHTHTHRERGRERENNTNTNTHTHTYTHTHKLNCCSYTTR